jgi:hypothetical protein
MDKITFTLCQSGSLMLKNLPMTLFPNMPAGKDHDFDEKRFSKIVPSSRHMTLNVTAPRPVKLQVAPYASTEVTLKK